MSETASAVTPRVVLTKSEQFLRDHPDATWFEKRDAEVAARAATDAERKREKLDAAHVVGYSVLKLPKPEPLVPGLLDTNSLAVLYGASGSGKSFIALDIALRVATGEPWQSKHIHAASVLYVAAEGVGGLGDRVDAWSSQYKLTPPLDDMHFVTIPVNLFDEGWTDALVSLVRLGDFKLVVIDTLARSMDGGDENSARDVAIVVSAAERIRDASRACVLLVHHTGYDATHARGSTALRASLDTELEVKGSDRSITLTAKKQKNRADGDRWYLALEPREQSLVVVASAGSRGDDLRGAARDLLQVLADADAGNGLTATEWQRAGDCSERNFYLVRGRLVQRGLVTPTDGSRPRYSISSLGRLELGDRTTVETATT